MNTPITYTPDWIRPVDADTLFHTLWNDLAWVRHDKVPRREYYVNRKGAAYSYGVMEFARTYESQIEHEAISLIWLNVTQRCMTPFDTVFLNGYENGSDHLGWHSDDSPEMDDERPIAIITLGAEREIWFRQRPDKANHLGELLEVEKVKLAHGSLCVMNPGMQDTHQHRIPKAGFEPCGPRISLTFRGYVPVP
jgi:alkylated DNA repair dioxygenase AlkB